MDREFHDAFEQYYTEAQSTRGLFYEGGDFARAYGSIGPARLVELIDEGERTELVSQNLRLRPDARYLLLLNLAEMVVRPLTAVAPNTVDDLESAVGDDVRTILRAAAERPFGPWSDKGDAAADEGIPAHAVLAAVVRVSPELRVAGSRGWTGRRHG